MCTTLVIGELQQVKSLGESAHWQGYSRLPVVRIPQYLYTLRVHNTQPRHGFGVL